MAEREFLATADEELGRLEAALAGLLDRNEADFDYEMKPGGIIELEFDDGSRIIVNRHVAAGEIWLAARSGGFHFRPPETSAGHWSDTRDGESLPARLSRCISEQSGAAVRLDW